MSVKCCPEDCDGNCSGCDCNCECDCGCEKVCLLKRESSSMTKSYDNVMWFMYHKYTFLTISHLSMLALGVLGGRNCSFRFSS